MAAKPIERYVKKQIADQGGWPRILERLSSGETVADISRTLLRTPQGPSISRAFLSRLLHQDDDRSAQVVKARREGASAMVDDALHIVDSSPVDRDAVQHSRARAELRLKVAGLVDREAWGDSKQAINVQVNVADMHLDSLRHRIIENSRPLAAVLHQVLPLHADTPQPAMVAVEVVSGK
jgi:hypothetical protein